MADADRSQQVSLGCGTLILIALIVLIFGGGRDGEVRRELQGLDNGIRQLQASVEAQAEEIRALRRALEARPPPAPRAEGEEKK